MSVSKRGGRDRARKGRCALAASRERTVLRSGCNRTCCTALAARLPMVRRCFSHCVPRPTAGPHWLPVAETAPRFDAPRSTRHGTQPLPVSDDYTLTAGTASAVPDGRATLRPRRRPLRRAQASRRWSCKAEIASPTADRSVKPRLSSTSAFSPVSIRRCVLVQPHKSVHKRGGTDWARRFTRVGPASVPCPPARQRRMDIRAIGKRGFLPA